MEPPQGARRIAEGENFKFHQRLWQFVMDVLVHMCLLGSILLSSEESLGHLARFRWQHSKLSDIFSLHLSINLPKINPSSILSLGFLSSFNRHFFELFANISATNNSNMELIP
jgi:hypothetical protein